MHSEYPNLFSPYDLAGVRLKNRLAMAPMSTQYGGKDGSVQPRHIAFYRERALGGFGLIIVEFTCVDTLTGRTEEHQLSLDSRANLDGHKRLVDGVKSAGAACFVQLQHGGRFADKRLVGLPKAASSVYSRKDPTKLVSGEFTTEEVERLVEKFAYTARLCKEAGYDGIEVHAAHGYLVSQFVSPNTNLRDDKWGGDADRRMAFPTAIARAIKAEVGAMPLVFRLSVDEFLPGGVTIEDSIYNSKLLAAAGTDAIHASTGRGPDSFERVMEPMSTPEGWRVPLARRIREEAGVPVITVGQIRTPAVAEAAIADGSADLVALGRPTLADAHWARKVEEGRFDDVRPCTSCNWCIGGNTHPMTCAENPRTGYELDPIVPADTGAGRKAVVIGAGPGGLSAALMLAEAGFDTHLHEARAYLGGGLIASAMPPGKDKFFWYRDYLLRRLDRSAVKVHLGSSLDAAGVIALKPDVVFVAAGTRNRPMDVPGITGPRVLDSFEILMGGQDAGLAAGQGVVVYGGGETGCETAEYFADRGVAVTLVSRSPAASLARAAERIYRKMLLQRLAANPLITLVPDTTITQIAEDGTVTLVGKDGTSRTLAADRVIIAQGRDPADAMIGALMAAGIETQVVGDSHKVGRIGHAVHDAYHALRAMAAVRTRPTELAC
ncbi:FAD-dependent oxidoreductase [Novosphingobium bradum]|uniref:FAD-dependent oxidoreductase n=1 Tax=Novosphingobium bradum TaxID=1737444 RepID=A0ABV7IPT8_9SPHN